MPEGHTMYTRLLYAYGHRVASTLDPAGIKPTRVNNAYGHY